ncbi:MAG TPA: hypothetical protein VG168_08955, partial [Bryobacteraceae bacterium]|nr:hypothetical protein [Bryobacteraceae bacterium]
ISGTGDSVKQGVLSPSEALRYAMSLPVAVTITGMENLDIVRQNLALAQNFEPMNEQEMAALRTRCAEFDDGRYELYKTSLKFDNPEARLAHYFPLDMQQREVKEMVRATSNTGKPFPSDK